METNQNFYIQYCGSWIIAGKDNAADTELRNMNLPNEGGKNGKTFAKFLQRHKLGKRIYNISNLMPELVAIATNY